MKNLLLVSLGGVAGTLARYWLSLAIPDDRSGTLAANLIGVAIASFFLVLMERGASSELGHLLLPGFCAGMTTFSAVMVKSIEPVSGGAVYLIENIILSLIIASVFIPISRKLIPAKK
jgi:fluoride exporter